MDYVDLFQIHRWDDETPIEETMEALHDCVKAGKVRYIGASNYSGWQLMKSLAAADRYGLKILAANIEDEPDNTTRFLVIGRQIVAPSGNDMTSILLSSHNRPGALYDLLRPFSDAGVNLTRIESRPSRRAQWDYNFFVDIEGHSQSIEIKNVLDGMRDDAAFFKFLGSYPRAVV